MSKHPKDFKRSRPGYGWTMTGTISMPRLYMRSVEVTIGDTAKTFLFESCHPVMDARIDEWVERMEAGTLTLNDETIAYVEVEGERQVVLGIEKIEKEIPK